LPKKNLDLTRIHTIAFDFDGVFTDNKVWVDQDGRESVRCDRADGLAFDMLRAFQRQEKLNFDCFILSKEPNPVVLSRAKKLKLPCHHNISNKLLFMKEYLTQVTCQKSAFDGLLYVGNDLNDFSLMSYAGYGIAPCDAHPMIRNIADIVLTKRGGEGCVREVIEHLIGIDLLSKEKLHELISNC
jgi:3-deoxy-D-manno-octulosonate 8-phosphate phosphatase (KDO 8-P phosphatase)